MPYNTIRSIMDTGGTMCFLLILLSDCGCYGNTLRRADTDEPKGDVPAYFALRDVRWQLVAGAGGWVEADIDVTHLGIDDLSISWMQMDNGKDYGDYAYIPLPGIFRNKTLNQDGRRTYITSRQQVQNIAPGRSCQLFLNILQIVSGQIYAGPTISYQFPASLSSDVSSAPKRTILELLQPVSFPHPIHHYKYMEDVTVHFQSLLASDKNVTVDLMTKIETTRGNPSGVELIWLAENQHDDDNIKFSFDQITTGDGQSLLTTHLKLFGLKSAAKYEIRVNIDVGEGCHYHQDFSILLAPDNQNSIFPHNAIEARNCRNPGIRDGIMKVPAGYSNCVGCHAYIPDGTLTSIDLSPSIDSADGYVLWFGDEVYYGYTFFHPTESYQRNYTCSMGFEDGSKMSETIQLEIISLGIWEWDYK